MIRFIFIILILSCISLGVGLVSPTMKVIPKAQFYEGDYTKIFRILFPEEFSSTSYSIIEGIELMLEHGSYTIGWLILGFSVIFPIIKLLLLWHGAMRLSQDRCPGWTLKFVEKLGKFSMIDVFVISVLIVTVKGMPGGTQIRAEWGLYVFTFSVVLSIIAGFSLAHLAENRRTSNHAK